ncbi:MAG: hypothetical protein P1V35_04535 [Planctomycetota bacterium]|nr:hypothetical protein [Planctomycetota bacterium]
MKGPRARVRGLLVCALLAVFAAKKWLEGPVRNPSESMVVERGNAGEGHVPKSGPRDVQMRMRDPRKALEDAWRRANWHCEQGDHELALSVLHAQLLREKLDGKQRERIWARVFECVQHVPRERAMQLLQGVWNASASAFVARTFARKPG